MGRAQAPNNQSDGHDAIMNPVTKVAGWLLKHKSQDLAICRLDMDRKFCSKFWRGQKRVGITWKHHFWAVRFQICRQIFAKKSGSWDIQFVDFSCPQLYRSQLVGTLLVPATDLNIIHSQLAFSCSQAAIFFWRPPVTYWQWSQTFMGWDIPLMTCVPNRSRIPRNPKSSVVVII